MKSDTPTSQPWRSPASQAPRHLIILSWMLVAACAILIFWISAKDGTTLDEDSGIVSLIKAWLAQLAQMAFGRPVDVSPVGHFCEYLALGATLANALRFHMPLQRAAVLAAMLASAYGASDEFHQLFVPDRSCDPVDWVVDTIAGTLAAVTTTAVLKRRLRTKDARQA